MDDCLFFDRIGNESNGFWVRGCSNPISIRCNYASLQSPDRWSGSCYNIKHGICRKCNRVIDRYDLLTPRPSKFIGGFIFLLGVWMLLGQEIEKLRIKYGIPVWIMCNSLNLLTEQEYWRIVSNRGCLSVYQLIMLVSLFQHPLDNIPNRCLCK